MIKADKEGKEVLNSLFDVALKSGGMANFESVVKIMDSVQDIEEIEEEKKENK